MSVGCAVLMIVNINNKFVIPIIIAALTIIMLEGLATVSLSNDAVPSSFSALAFHTGTQGGNVSQNVSVIDRTILAANNYINEARQALQNGNITVAYLYLDQAQDQLSILSSGDVAMSVSGIINAPDLGIIAQPGSSPPISSSPPPISSPAAAAAQIQTQQPTTSSSTTSSSTTPEEIQTQQPIKEQHQPTPLSPRQEPPDLEPREPPGAPTPREPPDPPDPPEPPDPPR